MKYEIRLSCFTRLNNSSIRKSWNHPITILKKILNKYYLACALNVKVFGLTQLILEYLSIWFVPPLNDSMLLSTDSTSLCETCWLLLYQHDFTVLLKASCDVIEWFALCLWGVPEMWFGPMRTKTRAPVSCSLAQSALQRRVKVTGRIPPTLS